MAKKTKADTDEQQKLKELEDKVVQMESSWKRALADYQNLEKRTRDQNSFMAQLASLSIIEKLLPLLDHLELAEKHVKDPGLTMVTKQFMDILTSEGVEPIEVKDKPFDPILMECIEQIPGKKDVVVEELARGYRLGDRVIRPAKVKVGNGEMSAR